MDSDNAEALLARLVEVNENISNQLSDLKSEISEMRSELNWADDLSFGKQVYDYLSSIDHHLHGIQWDISMLATN